MAVSETQDLNECVGLEATTEISVAGRSLNLGRLLVTYRISVSALAIMHSPRSADSDGRHAAVDGQLHPVHEARIV